MVVVAKRLVGRGVVVYRVWILFFSFAHRCVSFCVELQLILPGEGEFRSDGVSQNTVTRNSAAVTSAAGHV